MKRLVLANALANIDFDLLVSDNVRSIRGYWGEIIEIRLPNGIIFAYLDENNCGFIKLYNPDEGKKIEELSVTKENLCEILKNSINKLKGTC